VLFSSKFGFQKTLAKKMNKRYSKIYHALGRATSGQKPDARRQRPSTTVPPQPTSSAGPTI